MQIREANINDAEEISLLLKKSITALNSSNYEKHEIDAWVKYGSKDRVETVIKDIDTRVFLAVDGENIIAYMSLSLRNSILNSLYVDPSNTKKGVGSQLLDFAENLSRSRGHEEMSLSSTHTAFPFYLKKGYKKIDDISLLVNDVKIPVVSMIKSL